MRLSKESVIVVLKYEKIWKQVLEKILNNLDYSLLRIVLYGCSTHTPLGKSRRNSLFVQLFSKRFKQVVLNSELCSFLSLQLEGVSEEIIETATDSFLELCRTFKDKDALYLDLMPVVFSQAMKFKTLKSPIDESERICGNEYKEKIIEMMIDNKWDATISVYLAMLMKDVQISNSLTRRLINELLKSFSALSLEELPPLVYQMLILAKGNRAIVFHHLSQYFNSLNAVIEEEPLINEELLEQIQSTLVEHVSFGIKQNQDLGNEFLKYVKQDKTRNFNAFNVAILLSIAKIPQFEDQVNELCRTSVLTIIKDNQMVIQSRIMMNEESQLFYVNVEELFETAVRYSTGGVSSLINLAFSLLDSSFSIFKNIDKPLEWKLNEFSINEKKILNQIFIKISCKNNVSFYAIELFKRLISSCPTEMLEFTKIIEDFIFKKIKNLSFCMIETFFSCLDPLICLDCEFHADLLEFSKKISRSKILMERKVLLYLTFSLFRSSLNSSFQNSESFRESFSLECAEILSIFLYSNYDFEEKLLNLISSNPQRQNLNLNYFEIHLKQKFDSLVRFSENKCKIVWDKIIHANNHNMNILEPLGLLLLVYSKVQPDKNNYKINLFVTEIANIQLENIVGPELNFDSNSDQGKRNLLILCSLIPLMEASAEYLIENENSSIKLLEKIIIFNALLKDKLASKKASPLTCILSTEFLFSLLNIEINNDQVDKLILSHLLNRIQSLDKESLTRVIHLAMSKLERENSKQVIHLLCEILSCSCKQLHVYHDELERLKDVQIEEFITNTSCKFLELGYEKEVFLLLSIPVNFSSKFLKGLLRMEISDIPLAKLILKKILKQKHSVLVAVCRDFMAELGQHEADAEIPEEKTFSIVTSKNVQFLASITIDYINEQLDLLNWILETCTMEYKEDEQVLENLFEIVHNDFNRLASGLSELSCTLFNDLQTDQLISSITEFYKSLTNITLKHHIKQKRAFDSFKKTIHLISEKLSPFVYDLIPFVQNAKRAKKKKNDLEKKQGKDLKIIPAMVYSMEQFERFLLKLAEKNQDLLAGVRKSTARDFKLTLQGMEPKKRGGGEEG
ncbi:hypothetical protein ROZALSC1DRAFT_28748 [Rozella allomycis CSF55]|uniref:Uncharacterized protein n=1 Tax=Rozella allomycis (strain CSF55) TaxID=988480 RepID=A0A4P9YL97_ROZAC|nr:hypothetical protein ROZALSC1DRAFT_28748 [Rozella allomycis CSF55]